MLAVRDAEQRFDTTSLRVCVSAGEALPEEIYRRWRERFGVEILDGSARPRSCTSSCRTAPARRGGLVGLPVPATSRDRRRRRAARAAGRDRQPAGQGRLDDGRVLEQAREDQGDPPRRLDPDRRQVLPGRGRRLLVRGPRGRHAQVGGIWVSPVEVEATLIRHPAVLEAAVVGTRTRTGSSSPRPSSCSRRPGRPATSWPRSSRRS